MPFDTATPEPDRHLAQTLEWSRSRADLRQPSADELRLLTEARAAGATFPTPYWTAYFSGSSLRFPLQFEGCSVHAEDFRHADIVEACEAQAARRDAFLARCAPGGDLRPLVDAIDASLIALKAAA